MVPELEDLEQSGVFSEVRLHAAPAAAIIRTVTPRQRNESASFFSCWDVDVPCLGVLLLRSPEWRCKQSVLVCLSGCRRRSRRL
jgi:hypothetical protein